jgi:hypothetical protein
MDTQTIIAQLRKEAMSGDNPGSTSSLMLEAARTIEQLLARRETVQTDYSHATKFVYTGPMPTTRYADGGVINLSISIHVNENADHETVASIANRSLQSGEAV